jgi:hypothetical protein
MLAASIDVGNDASPAFADIDGDEDYDLFLGEGRITFYRNQGSPYNPIYNFETDNYAGIDVGIISRPVFADIDADGDLDLFVGEGNGNVNYFRNMGDRFAADYILIDENYAGISLSVPCKSSI